MRQYFKENPSPFHIYNRGVDKRVIFLNNYDYERFIALMYICNRGVPLYLSRKNIAPAVSAILTGGKFPEGLYEEKHTPLVAFVSFALMPNHFHFEVMSLQEGGISKYMQKLTTAYTKYFNKLNERSGSLLQGSYQSIEVRDSEYLYHLSRYIHLNPAELKEPQWKNTGVMNWEEMKEFLRSYKWSSYPDFIGERNSLIVDKKLVGDLFGEDFGGKVGPGLYGYEQFVEEWFARDAEFIKEYTLE